jgi:methyl-accepting chemotaxis protein
LKNNWSNLFNGKRSIRFEIFWAFVFSLLIAIFSFFIANFLASFLVNQLRFGYYFFNTAFIAFGIGFIVSFYRLTRRMVEYIIDLADGLQTISEGNLSYRVPIVRKDELGRVALNINLMAERLQRQIEKERPLSCHCFN